ncbi:MAG: HD domain-containing protein [Patescibacteria group bacterium]
MQFNLDEAIEKIKNNKDFLELKDIIENNRGHNNESVYDHCVATLDRMRQILKGRNIANTKAKEEFEKFLNQTVGGIFKKDLLSLAALLHDVGKANTNKKNPDGTTSAPNHGYWGSTIVPQLTKELNLSEDALEYISGIVRFHMGPLKDWQTTAELMEEVKKGAQNFYVEVLLLLLADAFNHPNFQSHKPMIIEVLNNPRFYS